MAHQKVTSDFPTAELPQIGAGKVDVIVVYKVDRLTRSLSDFAKLVDREPHLTSQIPILGTFLFLGNDGRRALSPER